MSIYNSRIAFLMLASPVAAAFATPRVIPTAEHRQSLAKAATTLTRFGYGAIRIGMRPEELQGYTLTQKPDGYEDCYVFGIKEVPDLEILVTEDIIKRISIGGKSVSKIRTAEGIGIGSTERGVRNAYRSINARGHQYVDGPALYLTWLPNGGVQGLRFETGTDRRVKVIHAGVMPVLGYVEGCA